MHEEINWSAVLRRAISENLKDKEIMAKAIENSLLGMILQFMMPYT